MFDVSKRGDYTELRLSEKFFSESGMLIQACPLAYKSNYINTGQKLLSIESGKFLKTILSPISGVVENFSEDLFNFPEKWTKDTALFLVKEMSKEEYDKAFEKKESPSVSYTVVANPRDFRIDIDDNWADMLPVADGGNDAQIRNHNDIVNVLIQDRINLRQRRQVFNAADFLVGEPRIVRR